MKCLQFLHTDELVELEFDLKKSKIETKLSKLSSFKQKIIKLYEWKYEDMIIECYGTKDIVEKLPINTHKLPCCEKYILYGDLFLVAKINLTYCDFDISQYAEFSSIHDEYSDVSDNSDDSDEEIDEYHENITIVKKNVVTKHIFQDKILDFDTTTY